MASTLSVGGVIALGIGLIVIGVLLIYLVRIHIAYKMAKNRHRDPIAWALLSFFVSPLLTWVLLLIFGNADN